MARGRFRGQGPRLKKTWFASAVIDAVSITTTQGELAAIQFVEGSTEVTLLRQRGSILITATPDAIVDSDTIGLGLVLVPETTRAVGGASLPGPIVDAGADFWIWHTYVPLDAYGVNTEAPSQEGGASWERVVLDGKAMRRWPADMSLVLVAEASSGDFADVSANGAFRVLFGG